MFAELYTELKVLLDKSVTNHKMCIILCYIESIKMSKPSKRKADTSEEYLKWKFSKDKGKKGLYFEYKAVPTEKPLVNVIVFKLTTVFVIVWLWNWTAENPWYSVGCCTWLCRLLSTAQGSGCVTSRWCWIQQLSKDHECSLHLIWQRRVWNNTGKSL